MNSGFPPEYQAVLASLAHEPPQTQAMFKYALAVLLIAEEVEHSGSKEIRTIVEDVNDQE